MPEFLPKALSFVILTSGILLPELLGFLSSDYSSSTSYLSELGAVGAPFSQIINYFGFLPVGITTTLLISILWRRLPQRRLVKVGLVCLLGVAVGYLGAFFFPCDLGCPATGSSRQALHNLAGLIEYVGGVGGLLLLYVGLRSTMHGLFPHLTLVAACAVTLGVFLMFNPEYASIRGVSQRLADYTIFIWLCIGVLLTSSHPSNGIAQNPQ